MRRRMVGVALIAGVLAGAAGAAVRAEDGPRADDGVRAAGAAAPAAATATPFWRLADGRYDPRYNHPRLRNVRIVARADDPAGGPAWAVRIFDVERVKLKLPARTLAGGKVVGREHCVQIGRVQGGEFGWVYGASGFQRTDDDERLMLCTSPKRPEAMAQMLSALAIGGDPSAPRIVANVVYGFLPGAAAASVVGTDGLDGPATGSGGAFLRVAGPAARVRDGARLEGGGQMARLTAGPIPARLDGHYPTLIGGSERVEAPAPDPAGGPRYGVPVAETEEGRPCVGSPGQVVGGRAGYADLQRAVAWSSVLSASACAPLSSKLDAGSPCRVGVQFGGGDRGEDAFLERAKVERRIFAGRRILHAECSPEVERVTLATPRDIRTLMPSALGHAVLAVYDGGFVDGEIAFTAHLRGGKRWTLRLPLGLP